MLSTGSAAKDNDVSAKQKLQKAALSIGGNEIKKMFLGSNYSNDRDTRREMSTIALDIMPFLFVHYIVLYVQFS